MSGGPDRLIKKTVSFRFSNFSGFYKETANVDPFRTHKDLIRFERIRTGSGIARCNLVSFTKIFALTKVKLGLDDQGVEKPVVSRVGARKLFFSLLGGPTMLIYIKI